MLASRPRKGIITNYKHMRTDIIGYFTEKNQTIPEHDPGPDGKCPVCALVVGRHSDNNPLKTISLMWEDRWPDRSYFFRVHKPCWEALSDGERAGIEESVLPEKFVPSDERRVEV